MANGKLKHQLMRGIMTLSFGRLTPVLLQLLSYLKDRQRFSRLDLNALSDRDIADLNLTPEMKGQFMAKRYTEKIRCGF